MNVKNFIVSFCSLSLISITGMGQNTLTFDPTKFIVQSQEFQGKTVKVRAFEKMVCVANPADIVHEVMNIYIPEEYFNGETINGYTAQTGSSSILVKGYFSFKIADA